MITIQEATKASDLAKNYSSKLKNMNLHLREILAKKARLEIEIKLLKKSIKEKQVNYERNLRVSLQLNSSETINPKEPLGQFLIENSLNEEIIEFDRQLLAYQNILEDYQEE